MAWATVTDKRPFILTGDDMPLKDEAEPGGCREDPSAFFDATVWGPTYACIDGKSYWMIHMEKDCVLTLGMCQDP